MSGPAGDALLADLHTKLDAAKSEALQLLEEHANKEAPDPHATFDRIAANHVAPVLWAIRWIESFRDGWPEPDRDEPGD